VLGFSIAFAMCMSLLCAHPFATYPLSLWWLARRRGFGGAQAAASAAGAPVAWPDVAICMCAYNEERVIAAKMDSLLAMAADYPGRVSIHVYVDGIGDGTARIVEGYAGVADLVIGPERRGKSWGMAQLVDRSDAELLLFTDANVMAGADSLTRLAAPFADPRVGLASARLRYSNRDESPTSRSGAVYWEVEEAIKRLESATIGLVGVDGAMFAVRRATYCPPPPHLIDDLYVSLGVLLVGARILSVEGVTVFERSAARAEEEFARKKRIACQAWNVHRALWPQLRRMPAWQLYGYLSHRVLKWWLPVVVVLAALGWLGVAVQLAGPGPAMLAALAGAALLALASAAGVHAASLIVTTLYSLAGVGVGLGESIALRRTYTVWAPAESVRGERAPRVGAHPVAPVLTGLTHPTPHIERTGADA